MHIAIITTFLQKALSFTSGLTTGLQKRGIDLADSCEQVELLIRTLKRIRDEVDEFHHDCFTDACKICDKLGDQDAKNLQAASPSSKCSTCIIWE